MRLFHYTGREHLRGIQRDGITHGRMLLPDDTLAGGFQWLTRSDEWAQTWATQHMIHCDRSELRFVVQIPNILRPRLHRWIDYARQFSPEWVTDFNDAGGGAAAARDWFIYQGWIPSALIVAVEFRPKVRS